MKLKKIAIPAMGAFLALSLAACSDTNEKDNSKDNDKPKEEVKQDSMVTYVNPSDILEKIESKETFAFVIGNQFCGACQFFKENTLTKLDKEEGIKLPFIETEGLEKEKANAEAFVKLVEDHLGGKFDATPTTYFMVDGELKEEIVGAMEYEVLVKKYDEHIGFEDEENSKQTEENSEQSGSKEEQDKE